MKSVYIFAALAVIAAAGCRSNKQVAASDSAGQEQAPTTLLGGSPSMAIPKAVVYKTNGDYCDNVAVNVSPDGKRLMSYPAPTDVSAKSSPIALSDGWLLDRRGGIGENTRFLTYTYSEYAKLPAAPSQSELLESIIPDARVTACKVLPVNASEAIANPSLAEEYLK